MSFLKLFLFLSLSMISSMVSAEVIDAKIVNNKLQVSMGSVDVSNVAYFQFYIDIDNNPNTGYTSSSNSTSGADYLFEGNGSTNNQLLQQNANSSSWNFNTVSSSGVDIYRENSYVEANVPLSLLPSIGTIKVNVQLRDSNWNLLNPGVYPASSMKNITVSGIQSMPVDTKFDWNLKNLSEYSDQAFRNYIDQVASNGVNVIDVDLFNTSEEKVNYIKSKGMQAIAYISVGSWESYAPDADQFPPEFRTNNYNGYPNEKWLNLSEFQTNGQNGEPSIEQILINRLDLAVEKGFDGIEPDNFETFIDYGDGDVGGYGQTHDDGRVFMDWLIDATHERGLHIGQKNIHSFAVEYSDRFDWFIMENSFGNAGVEETSRNEAFNAYYNRGKAVIVVEYIDDVSYGMTTSEFNNNVCNSSISNTFTAILKTLSIGEYTYSCQ